MPGDPLLKRLWRRFRELSGDDAYERYLAHSQAHHADEGLPLDRAEFFRRHQEQKWGSTHRCC
jgi:uncharacterized short protein YbdD (DUF466 family)